MTTKTVYAVTKNGVHVTMIFGILEREDAAQALAESLANADKDTWHTFCVEPFNLNELVPFHNCPVSGIVPNTENLELACYQKGEPKGVKR